MTEKSLNETVPGSFRDPSGFLFTRDEQLCRQINTSYRTEYDCLMQTGLYDALVSKGLLIPHEEVDIDGALPEKSYKVIRPEKISFISYPYEWCFSQLKTAALTTIRVQKMAMEFGMSLKDCSAYNVQFMGGIPVFIDTLSFEKYEKGRPWVAYRQFCQHFLAPLALMCHTDIRLSKLFRVYVDGIPLSLAGKLLPFYTKFIPSLIMHIHAHAKCQDYFADKAGSDKNLRTSQISFLGLIDNLRASVMRMNWRAEGTEWAEYYKDTNYSPEASAQKKKIVAELMDKANPGTVWDIGANTGIFSAMAGDKGINTVSLDADPSAVEKNYLDCVAGKRPNVLPLVMDVTNTSPGIGWENTERSSLFDRGPADLVFALALVHHLAISNNLPFDKIASMFAGICRDLIIEFVPKEDSQVCRLLAGREDIFPKYDRKSFECEFGRYFELLDSMPLQDSKRILYLMRKKDRP